MNYNSFDGSAATFPKGQGQNHLNLAPFEKNSTVGIGGLANRDGIIRWQEKNHCRIGSLEM